MKHKYCSLYSVIVLQTFVKHSNLWRTLINYALTTPRPYALACYTLIMNSRVGSVARLLFVDLLGSVVWFPAWWYTEGLTMVVRKILSALRYRARAYSFSIWIKNFFVPMYGQYDITGRLVSVLMRTVVLIGRLIAIVIEAIFYLVGLLIWPALPPVALLFAIGNMAKEWL